MAHVYRFAVRRPLKVLSRIISVLGEEAELCIQGDVSLLKKESLQGARSESYRGFVVPLTLPNRKKLIESEFPRIGIRSRIHHIEIFEEGVLKFYSYDNFHFDCTGADQTLPQDLFDELQTDGAIQNLRILDC